MNRREMLKALAVLPVAATVPVPVPVPVEYTTCSITTHYELDPDTGEFHQCSPPSAPAGSPGGSNGPRHY